MTTHCKPTTSRFVNCDVPRLLPKIGLTISVEEQEKDLPPGESLIVSFSIGPFFISCVFYSFESSLFFCLLIIFFLST